MKTQPTLLLGAVSLIAVVLSWTSGLNAGVRGPADSISPLDETLDELLDQKCVVTVDPLALPTAVYAGSANVTTGFEAPNTIEGVVIRMDSEWMVLRDGNNQNWIPKSKIILIHVCL